MSHKIAVTFLGTTSGGGPSETRNCSSLVIDPLGDGSLWTDHTAGLLNLLRNILGIPKPPSARSQSSSPSASSSDPPRLEIYGPRGLRRFLRVQFLLTHTHTEFRYVVHELLRSEERPSVPGTLPSSGIASSERIKAEEEGISEETSEIVRDEDMLLENEAPGKDIPCDAHGFWRTVAVVNTVGGKRSGGKIVVDAGPIEHRDPCIGYVIREIPNHPSLPDAPVPRKIVILGDTSDPSTLIPLIDTIGPERPALESSESSTSTAGASQKYNSAETKTDDGIPATPSPVTLLIHEATDAYIPSSIDPQERTGRKRTAESVEAKARDRGHSTPAMAGTFARRIGAERLVLNHIGSRFPAPAHPSRSPADKFRLACLHEIERQALHAWAPPNRRARVQAAWDFMYIVLEPNPAPSVSSPPSEISERRSHSTRTEAEDAPRHEQRAGKRQNVETTSVETGERVSDRHNGQEVTEEHTLPTDTAPTALDEFQRNAHTEHTDAARRIPGKHTQRSGKRERSGSDSAKLGHDDRAEREGHGSGRGRRGTGRHEGQEPSKRAR
ncbi:uncharacterized protein FIBRA_07443 [Fibroporia radiculosa]|uniref:Metallo-beta-lactamase domain-containing protein n=1 Tax=Fibroporia radiculosa TaxID=599839 RepID=J4GEG4_9APHY|nr:uncharacterized protein FIBRA_07443 [Fibroporia radiculosa]CCM05233.1 predicted protein [Fibroporia radiculosa]